MSFEDTFNKVLGKYQRMFDKIEHRRLKRIYLGKENAFVIKRKGLRKDSPKRKQLEEALNYAYLKSYGKIKKDVTEAGIKYLLG